MLRRTWGGLIAVAAAAGGLGLAIAVGSAGASGQAPITTTLGSTTGTPNQNICAASINCTYVPFSSASTPGLQVPVNGTVTSFSVNSGSAGAALQLRVLRPAPNGQFTGAGTSATETTSGGPQTFTLSTPLPVKAGDVLALDNATSALLFTDSSATTAFTSYYQPPPGIPDGTTGAPTNNKLFRLLLSAVVTGTTPTPTTTNGTTVTTTVSGGTTTVVKTVTPRPVIGNPTQSRTVWTRRIGTTFALGLGGSAKLLYVFRQRFRGHSKIRGTLAANGHAGTNRLRFKGRVAGGKKLAKGQYTVTITATNNGGVSKPVSLKFTITG